MPFSDVAHFTVYIQLLSDVHHRLSLLKRLILELPWYSCIYVEETNQLFENIKIMGFTLKVSVVGSCAYNEAQLLTSKYSDWTFIPPCKPIRSISSLFTFL